MWKVSNTELNYLKKVRTFSNVSAKHKAVVCHNCGNLVFLHR